MIPLAAAVAATRLFELGPWGGLAFVALVFLVAAALGSRALKLLRASLPAASELERLLLGTSLGIGLIQVLIFALGMAHLFRPVALGALFGALFVLSLLDIRSVVRAAVGVAASSWRGSGTSIRAAIVLVALALLVKLPSAMAMVTDPDGIWYHVGAPSRWLEMGYLGYLPTLNMTIWPMGTEMLFSLGLVFAETAPKLMHFALGVLLLLSVYALGKRLYGGVLGFVAAVGVVLVFPGTTMTMAYVDASISYHVACALLAFAGWIQSADDDWLTLSALCAGIAASSKLTGAPLGVMLALAAALRIWKRERAYGVALRRAALFTGLALAPLLLFFARAAVLTGNPVYPFLSGLIPTRDWNPAAGVVMDRFFKYINWGQERGFSMATRVLIHHAMAAVGVAVAVFGGWYYRKRPEFPLVVVVGAWLVVFLWSGGPYTRFLLPVISVAVVFVLAPLVGLLRAASVRHLLCAGVALASLVVAARSVRAAEVKVAAGTLGRDAFLRDQMPISAIWQYVNSCSPPGAVILTIFPAVFYLDRTSYVVDPVRDQFIHYDSWDRFREDVARHGICYVIAPRPPIPESMALLEYPPARNAPRFVERLVTESGRELAQAGDSSLYELTIDSCAGTRIAEACSTGAQATTLR